MELITLYLLVAYQNDGVTITEKFTPEQSDEAISLARQKNGKVADVTDKGWYLIFES